MNKETKILLARWQSLEQGDGLRQARSFARLLWLIGLVLCLFVVFGIIYRFPPVAVAVAATTMGWVTAERNALVTKLAQWPTFKRYVDWKRVGEDLANGKQEA
jgi:hypothetical protein